MPACLCAQALANSVWALAHICACSPAAEPHASKLHELDSMAGKVGAMQAFLEAAACAASRLLAGLDSGAQLLAAHMGEHGGRPPLAHMAAREHIFSCQVGCGAGGGRALVLTLVLVLGRQASVLGRALGQQQVLLAPALPLRPLTRPALPALLPRARPPSTSTQPLRIPHAPHAQAMANLVWSFASMLGEACGMSRQLRELFMCIRSEAIVRQAPQCSTSACALPSDGCLPACLCLCLCCPACAVLRD